MKIYRSLDIKFVFEIRDLWVGLYFGEFNQTPRKVWFAFFPTIPLCISWQPKPK